jgi:SAM-dependent methyltransferase
LIDVTQDWRAINLANWESRVSVHTGPGGYNLATFDDPTYLSEVVRYDLPRLGQLDGLDVVHLQCHLGTDTVSLARLGAQSTAGLDFSPSALLKARQLATRAATDVTFVDGDAYDAVDLLSAHQFDLVYTGIGAICWLPSIRRWARRRLGDDELRGASRSSLEPIRRGDGCEPGVSRRIRARRGSGSAAADLHPSGSLRARPPLISQCSTRRS